MIYPLDSAIQLLNNWGQYYFKSFRSLSDHHFPRWTFFQRMWIWTPGFSNKLRSQFLGKGAWHFQCGEAPLRSGIFFRLQVRRLIGSILDIFKRVRILEGQVYEKVGKSLTQVFLKGPLTKISQIIFSRRTFVIRIYSISAWKQQEDFLSGDLIIRGRWVKWVPLLIKDIRKIYISFQEWCRKRVRGWMESTEEVWLA